MKTPRLSIARWPWTVLAALTALGLSLVRALYLEHVAGAYTACHGCFMIPALGHDAWLLCAMSVVLAFVATSPVGWLALICRAFVALAILAQATDLILLRLFNQRLYVADLLRFSADATSAWSVTRAQFFSANGVGYAVGAALVLAVLAGLNAGSHRSPRQARVLLAFAALSAAFGFAASWMPLRYVHAEYVENVVEVNLPQGRERRFSAEFSRHAQDVAGNLPQVCDAGSRSGRNIVIVITESLSAYQSALFGGPHD